MQRATTGTLRPEATPEPVEQRVVVNGIEIAFFEFGKSRRGGTPTVLLVHATGFHARCWDQVVRCLGDIHVIAVDQRGHGRSEKVEITHWRVFGRDLAALVRELDLRDIIGVGHSMGGHAITEAAAACEERFLRLLLVDPVISSPDSYEEGGWALPKAGVHQVAKRKSRFASPQAMFARFEARQPYALFDRDVLRDYCDYGLLPDDDGDGWHLACPPAIEARVYMTSRSNPGVYDSIRSLELPVLILRARTSAHRRVMDFTWSPTWPKLVNEFRRGREIYLPDHTLFIALEDPELVAHHVKLLDSEVTRAG